MTQSTFLAESHGSDTSLGRELLAAVKLHLKNERASFHTPGHKGRLSLGINEASFATDLTELPGLDELAHPSSVLQSLQTQLAAKWNAKQTFISVNGASAALTAAIMCCAGARGEILLPRNVHRSALNALVFTGLDPIWYEPEWLNDWGTWGETRISDIQSLIEDRSETLAAIVVCSPNYAGVISDIDALNGLCRAKNVVLIVDEAHGAHLLPNVFAQKSALQCGADLVVHSLHKTLSAPTQTGLLHLSHTSSVRAERVAAAINSLQSSSPSYMLMLGIEQALAQLEETSLRETARIARRCRDLLAEHSFLEVLSECSAATDPLHGLNTDPLHGVNTNFLHARAIDPLHVLISHASMTADQLYSVLAEAGVYAEAVLGKGVLLLLGQGSTLEDLAELERALNILSSRGCMKQPSTAISEPSILTASSSNSPTKPTKPNFAIQELNPRRAFFADSTTRPISCSYGEIACDWIAPCPPGYPLVAPGQRITKDLIESFNSNISIRVVKQPQVEGDSDG